MQSITAHAISCLVLTGVCAGCSAVHKPPPLGKEHGFLESAKVSGPACLVTRQGVQIDVKFVEAGESHTFGLGAGDSADSIFQVSVFPPVEDKKCPNYKIEAGVLCMKCGDAADPTYPAKTGIACCP